MFKWYGWLPSALFSFSKMPSYVGASLWLQRGLSSYRSFKAFSLPALFCTLLLCSFSLTSCAKKEKGRDTFYMNMGIDPGTLNPYKNNALVGMFLIRNHGEGLTRINALGEPQLALAKSIESDDNGKSWRIVLRKAFWSSGERVTSDHFLIPWQKVLTKEIPAPLVEQLFLIKNASALYTGSSKLEELGLRKINDEEFVVELEAANPYFLHHLAVPMFFPLPSVVEEEEAPYYISCGPYRLREWNHNRWLVFEKNPLYWDEKAVKMEKIHVSILGDPQTQLELFELKELDWCGSPTLQIPEEAVQDLDGKGRLRRTREAKTQMLCFNMAHPITSNKKIRQALALSLNRRALIEHHIFSGEAAYGVIPASILGTSERKVFYENLALAKELWNQGCLELGLDPHRPEGIVFSHSSAENFKKKSQAIQDQWRQHLGAEIPLQSVERQLYNKKLLQGDYQIGYMGWGGDVPDPSGFLTIFKTYQGGRNFPCWFDQDYSDLLDLAFTTEEQKKREHILLQAEAILMEEMPVAPLAHPSTPYLVHPSLKGYFFDPLGFLDLKGIYFEESLR